MALSRPITERLASSQKWDWNILKHDWTSQAKLYRSRESAAKVNVDLHWGGEAKPVPRALQGCHLLREGGCSAERHKAGSTLSTDGLASSPSQSEAWRTEVNNLSRRRHPGIKLCKICHPPLRGVQAEWFKWVQHWALITWPRPTASD